MKAQSKNYILLICLYIPNIGYKSSLLQAGSYIHDYINNKLLYELKRCKNSVMYASVICSPSAQQMSTYLEAKWLPYDHLTQSDPV